MKARTLFLFCFAAAAAAWAAPADTPEEAALKIEAKLRSIRSLQSDYEHLYYSMNTSEPLSEKGKLYFQRPDRMRWDSREPEEQTFLSKDGTYLFYIPGEKQLIRSRGSKDRFESEILALFSGSMDFPGLLSHRSRLLPDGRRRGRPTQADAQEGGGIHLYPPRDGPQEPAHPKSHLLRLGREQAGVPVQPDQGRSALPPGPLRPEGPAGHRGHRG